jgi:hypothetical protein
MKVKRPVIHAHMIALNVLLEEFVLNASHQKFLKVVCAKIIVQQDHTHSMQLVTLVLLVVMNAPG